MRPVGNFHPEWGYLSPAPSFIRTARMVLVATAVGATAGASVVLSLAGRPAAETSVAARTLAQPPNAPPAMAQASTQAAAEEQPPKKMEDQSPKKASVTPVPSEAITNSTPQPPTGIAALAELPASNTAPAKAAANVVSPSNSAGPVPAAEKAPPPPATPKKITSRKPRVAPRYASRGAPLDLFNDRGGYAQEEYYPSRGYDGYYREGRWGGSYQDGAYYR